MAGRSKILFASSWDCNSKHAENAEGDTRSPRQPLRAASSVQRTSIYLSPGKAINAEAGGGGGAGLGFLQFLVVAVVAFIRDIYYRTWAWSISLQAHIHLLCSVLC